MSTQNNPSKNSRIVAKKNVIMVLMIICPFILLFLIYTFLGFSKNDIAQKKYNSVYEKLADGVPINVLVVGDSISAGAGSTKGKSWAVRIPEMIKTSYGSKCTLTNISMGGTTSIAGIMREEMLDDGINYDLVIICYGENDSDDESFASTYEGLVRTSQSRYPGCSIICVLESSQREYTNKMKTIMNIAHFYNIPIADTIETFNNSGYNYEELVNAPDDLTHPNNTGHEIYLNTIAAVISDQMHVETTFNTDSHQFDKTIFYSKSDFKKIGSKTFALTLDNPQTAKITIYGMRIPGENRIKVIVDDTVVYESYFEWGFKFNQEYIETVTNSPIYVDKNLVIEFSSTESAKDFVGIMLSGTE